MNKMTVNWRKSKRAYRDNEGRGGKGESCNFGSINTLVSQVLKISLKGACDLFSSNRFQTKSLGNGLSRLLLQSVAPAQLGGLHESSCCL